MSEVSDKITVQVDLEEWVNRSLFKYQDCMGLVFDADENEVGWVSGCMGGFLCVYINSLGKELFLRPDTLLYAVCEKLGLDPYGKVPLSTGQ